MNFISTFDELNKLYESADQEFAAIVFAASKDSENKLKSQAEADGAAHTTVLGANNNTIDFFRAYEQAKFEKVKFYVDSARKAELDTACTDMPARVKNQVLNNLTLVESADQELAEDTNDDEIEVVDDEAVVDVISAEEPTIVEDEPRQVICECDKCGALVIKDEADIVVDEETDLVNVEDECQFCEEANGFKIVGVVAPYEVALPNDADDEIEVSEESEDTVKEALTENFLDRVRKALDLPAPTIVQQFWEALLNNEFGEISPELRKDLENAFAQQRDWERRHPNKGPHAAMLKARKAKTDTSSGDLEEILDVSIPVNIQANNNEVAIGGATV